MRVAGRTRAAAGRGMTARGPGAPAAAAPPPRAPRAPCVRPRAPRVLTPRRRLAPTPAARAHAVTAHTSHRHLAVTVTLPQKLNFLLLRIGDETNPPRTASCYNAMTSYNSVSCAQ